VAKFDDILALCQKYDHLIPNSFFAFFCPVTEDLQRRISRLFPRENFLLKFLGPDEYKKALMLAMLAFITGLQPYQQNCLPQ
jgi:hypothetical protein